MKLAFVTLPVSGHLNPMVSLAAKVKSFGHDVSVISVPDSEERVRTAGLQFDVVGGEHFPVGAITELEKALSTRVGQEGLEYTFGLMGVVTSAIIRQVEEVLREGQFDGAVFDTYQPYLELAAMSLNLPYIHVSNATYFDVSGDTPPCFFPWTHEPGELDRIRNLEGVLTFRKLLEPSRIAAQEYANEKNLSVDWNHLSATRSKLAWITQIPEAFDFQPEVPKADEPYHAGPFFDAKDRLPIEFAWDKLSHRPLVYASMGTLQNGIEEVFRTIIDTAARLEQLQFVVVLGNKLDPALFEPLPSNVLLVVKAPQLELLKNAVLCITHAGLNTTLEALAHGLPLVALPVTNDQPGVAMRIASKGVGEFIPISDLTVDALAATVSRVMIDPRYRQNAMAMQNAIAKQDGLSMAANKIQSVFLANLPETVNVVAAP